MPLISNITKALALRVALAMMGVGSYMRSRMEIGSPATSLDAYAEAAFLHRAGAASLGGFQGSPLLLLPLAQAAGGRLLPAVLLASLADAASAALLQRLAAAAGCGPAAAAAAARALLWSPLAVLTCAGGSLAPLYVMTVLAAAAAAAEGRPWAAGAALAAAAHLAGGQLALCALPLALLLWQRAGSGARSWRCAQLAAAFVGAGAALAAAGGAALALALGGPPRRGCHMWPAWLASVPPFSGLCAAQGAGSWELWSELGGEGGGGAYDGPLPPGSSVVAPNLGLQWYLFAQVFPKFR
jgi:hypothetical protein